MSVLPLHLYKTTHTHSLLINSTANNLLELYSRNTPFQLSNKLDNMCFGLLALRFKYNDSHQKAQTINNVAKQ